MSDMQQPTNQGRQAGIAPVVERNIHALLARRQAEEARMGWQEKLAVATKQQGIEQARRPELEELARDVAPEQVLETMQQQEERARAEKELGRKKPE